MTVVDPMLSELLSQWLMHSSVAYPPSEPILLWADSGRFVAINNGWGPPVPYPPFDHGNGHQNHGYVRIKGRAETALRIPEVVDAPELGAFLIAVNSPDSPIESVGCEKAFFPVEGHDVLTAQLGSYVDLIFSEPSLNDRPENVFLLISMLVPAIEGCDRWWSQAEFMVQRLKGLGGAVCPWGLMLRVTGLGRDKEEARKFWGETVKRLTQAVQRLPKELIC